MQYKLLKNFWFWTGLLFLIVFAVVFDTVFLFFFFTRGISTLYSTHFNQYILLLGSLSSVLGALCARGKAFESRTAREVGKVLFIISIIWTGKDYGLLQAIFIMSIMLIVTRIIKWFVPKGPPPVYY